ncbi:MAG: leucine-rich repeat domain-containing protein, partial [Bacteroidota bacterium]|nr:leucine-rich repeat domain-containing protein [Bacteroidota bacterium]
MKIFISFLFLLLFFSCSNENTLKKNNDSLQNIVPKDKINKDKKLKKTKNNQFNDSLLNVLYSIDKSLRSELLNDYFKDASYFSYNKTSPYSLQFYQQLETNYKRENITFLKSLYNKEIICFSGFISDSKGIKNYFYFIQKINNKWINVSQMIVKRSIISLIDNNLTSVIRYKKFGDVYSFVSDYSNIPFYFFFDNKLQILFFSDSKWSVLAYLVFFEGEISILSNNKNSAKKNVLSDDELENSRIENNLNKALKKSQRVYILDLSGTSINKLSPQIANLNRLQILILNDNYLTRLSEELLQLPKLQILRINNNKLIELPEKIGKLQNIKEISASYNQLVKIPESVSKINSLEILNLSDNKLTEFVADCSQL